MVLVNVGKVLWIVLDNSDATSEGDEYTASLAHVSWATSISSKNATTVTRRTKTLASTNESDS